MERTHRHGMCSSCLRYLCIEVDGIKVGVPAGTICDQCVEQKRQIQISVDAEYRARIESQMTKLPDYAQEFRDALAPKPWWRRLLAKVFGK